jgi:hypothetical protein
VHRYHLNPYHPTAYDKWLLGDSLFCARPLPLRYRGEQLPVLVIGTISPIGLPGHSFEQPLQ